MSNPPDEMVRGILRAAALTWPRHHAFRVERQGAGPLYLIAYTKNDQGDEISQVLVSIDHPTPYNLLGSLLWNS